MAIRSRRNFKTQLGIADLTLTAKADESLLVTDVRIYEPTAGYTNFLIERTSVGYFRVASLLGSHLHFLPGRAAHAHDLTTTDTSAIPIAGNASRVQNAGGVETPWLAAVLANNATNERMMDYKHVPSSGQDTLLAYLRKKGIFKGYPVAEGETFTVELCTDAEAVKVVEYELYDAGDMKPEMENGSKAESYLYVNYGGSGAVIQAAADNVLGTPANPPEYPNFPFGAIVPGGHKIELIGILASDIGPALNDGADYTVTEYLKFMHGREVLFDEDHNGLLYYSPHVTSLGDCDMIAEGYSIGGNFTQCDCKEPHMFDTPIVFDEGEELVVSWHVVIGAGGRAITEELQEIGIIQRISPMG